MSKKTQAKKTLTRSLGTEPLEERLPISSSAAGVLFGLGLANDTTTAAYETPQTPRSESVVQQPTLIDLTLDLQLDALMVDLFHAEESLLDTISAASEDPFVLTPLTPSAALSDADNDTHREQGDELLLFQISTLDFTQVSFEPMMPERFEPVTPQKTADLPSFEESLAPPGDLTAYGYSPVANDLKENDGLSGGGPQMSCGCGGACGCSGGSGCGCQCEPPYVTSACLWGGVGCGTSEAGIGHNFYTGEYSYFPDNKTCLFFQNVNDTAMVNTCMSWAAPTGTGTITVTPVGGGSGGEGYWDTTTVSFGPTCTTGYVSHTFVWTKPSGVANGDALRDFKFTYSVSGGNSVELFVHIGYTEIKSVDFIDHGVLRTNWKQDSNCQWVWDDSYEFTGTVLGPNWYVDRKDAEGEYVSVGASYTKGSKVTVEATFVMDFGGTNLSYQIKGEGTNMEFQSGTLTGATGSSITMTSSVSLPGSINKFTTDLTWSILIGGGTYSAGISGPHTIYTTLDTPIVDEEATEKRMDWACSTALGDTTPVMVADDIWDAVKGGTTFGDPEGVPVQSWVLLDGTFGDCDDQARLMQRGCQILGLPAEEKKIRASTDNDCFDLEFKPNSTKVLIFNFPSAGWNLYESTCYVAGYYYAITPAIKSNTPLGILSFLKTTTGVTQWYVDIIDNEARNPEGPIGFPI